MDASILQTHSVPLIATMATKNAIKDLIILIESIQLWNTQLPTIYIYCDDITEEYIKKKITYNGTIYTTNHLEKYSQYDRARMEQLPGTTFGTLFTDFTAEKTNLIDWVFTMAPQEATTSGVYFLDADICFTAPLTSIQIPSNTRIALSPHYIRPGDEQRYGRYNAGLCWTNDPMMPTYWREKCTHSRFFEQAALEDVALCYKQEEFYEFPIQVNYGWWRMYQSIISPQDVLRTWSYNRNDSTHSGITVEGKPLVCVHTHFHETRDTITIEFNRIMRERLHVCRKNNLSAKLLRLLSQ